MRRAAQKLARVLEKVRRTVEASFPTARMGARSKDCSAHLLYVPASQSEKNESHSS